MRTLALTSPLMRGDDVRAAQWALLGAGFYEGFVDGTYGPVTAGAAREAKFRIGYAEKNINDRYGDQIHALVSGKAKQTAAQKLRAATRAKNDDTAGERHAAQSLELVGLKETPANSNHVPTITDWYGIDGPWCAMGQTKAGVMAGLTKTWKRGEQYAYCPYVVRDAHAGINGMREINRASSPIVPGLLALFDWDHDGVADHIGTTVTEEFLRQHAPDLLREAIDRHLGRKPIPSRGEFWCVEFNTSFGNDSDGGEGMIRIRNRADLRSLVRMTR